VAPLLTPEELKETKAIVAEFAKKEGPELHQAVVTYDQGTAAASGSYIEKYWDDAYLVPRDPIAINVNPFFMLQDDPSSGKNEQTVRTSGLIVAILKFWLRVKNRQLEPDEERGKPLCMSQYENVVAGVRLPQLTRDQCRTFPDSRHIVVMYRNHVFSFPVLGEQDEPLSEIDVQLNIQDIMQRMHSSPAGVAFGALTAENRTRWALVRSLMETNEINRKTLERIDSALFVVCLDDSATDVMNALSEIMLHGNGRTRWFDKSLQLIVTAHGPAGINMEHAAFDGHTLLRLATVRGALLCFCSGCVWW
jgi:carnitine O-acetyltransferase